MLRRIARTLRSQAFFTLRCTRPISRPQIIHPYLWGQGILSCCTETVEQFSNKPKDSDFYTLIWNKRKYLSIPGRLLLTIAYLNYFIYF